MEEKVETENQTILGCIPGNPGLLAAELHAKVLLGQLPRDTLLYKGVIKAGPRQRENPPRMGTAEASTDPMRSSSAKVVLDLHHTVKEGAWLLQSHSSQSLASDTPWAGRSQWLRVVPSEGCSNPIPKTEVDIWKSYLLHRLRLLVSCKFHLP